jgi:hypothetical protein
LAWGRARGFEESAPVVSIASGGCGVAAAVRLQTCGSDPDAVKVVVEYDEAGVESEDAVREFQVIRGFSAESGFEGGTEVVAPPAEDAAEREGQVWLFE